MFIYLFILHSKNEHDCKNFQGAKQLYQTELSILCCSLNLPVPGQKTPQSQKYISDENSLFPCDLIS